MAADGKAGAEAGLTLTALAHVKLEETAFVESMNEDPYGEGGDPFENYDQEGSRSYKATMALRKAAGY